MLRHILTRAVFLLAIMPALFAAGCGGGGGGGGIKTSGGGGGGGDTTAPSVTVARPSTGSSVSDVDFRSDAASGNEFIVEVTYSDSSAMLANSLYVTMAIKLESDSSYGAPQEITSYFTKVNDTTYRSSNLSQYTRTLFNLTTNDVTRNVRISATLKDSASNSGTGISEIRVYPVSPGVPPAPPPS